MGVAMEKTNFSNAHTKRNYNVLYSRVVSIQGNLLPWKFFLMQKWNSSSQVNNVDLILNEINSVHKLMLEIGFIG